MNDMLLKNGCRLKIARNRIGNIFRPNNEYWKQLHVKIIKGALPGGPVYLRALKMLPSQNRAKLHGKHI